MEGDPDLSHISSADYDNVYEPAEDSYLMMEALHKDEAWLQQRLPAFVLSLEVGIGTGILSSYLASKLPGYFLATDVNPRAAAIARSTFRRNQVLGDILRTDLVTGTKLQGKVDVMLFNPPYVPTPPEEMKGDGLSVAWAGGLKGREVLDRLLPSIPELLSSRGVLYLVVLDQNDPKELASFFFAHGFQAEMVHKRKAQNERLSIIKYFRDF